jgi:hypothetical protein
VAEAPSPRVKPGSWQDIVLGTGSTFFTLALIPTLMDPDASVPLWTSIPTAAFLYIFAVTKWTLRLKLAMLAETTTATAWVLVAILRS